jgi:hypothetical protein
MGSFLSGWNHVALLRYSIRKSLCARVEVRILWVVRSGGEGCRMAGIGGGLVVRWDSGVAWQRARPERQVTRGGEEVSELGVTGRDERRRTTDGVTCRAAATGCAFGLLHDRLCLRTLL